MRGFDWLKRRRLDEDDFQEEIRAHLAIATDERVADGAEPDAARMLLALGIAGMVLAALGLYGPIAFSVSQSTHEIGVRMALGAQTLSIVRGFLVRGVRLGVIGATLGLTAAVAVTRLLGSVLYGVSATDPGAFAGALGVVFGAVVVATVIPVWRGARTNPLSALRQS